MTDTGMSLTATRPRGARLRGDQYQCGRCGCIAKWSKSHGCKPTQCRDCRDVETTMRANESWGTP